MSKKKRREDEERKRKEKELKKEMNNFIQKILSLKVHVNEVAIDQL